MVGLPGTEIDPSTIELIRELRIHNFILFRRNVLNRNQLKKLCGDLARVCLESGLPPPLLSIDQEGGLVARLSAPFTEFPEPRQLAEDVRREEKLQEYSLVCARELCDLGINMNLAPVVDICPVGKGLFMERRCLGADAATVGRLGALVIAAMQGAGLAACAKHFPGLGLATLDPHLELPVVDLSEELMREARIPFVRAQEAGVAAIMTSHAVYPRIDDLPGTLSRKVVHALLREEMAYQGLIITDDLEMGAIEKFLPFSQAALQAFVAGADLLLICHDHDKVRCAHAAICSARSKGEIEEDAIAASFLRQQRVLNRLISP